MAAATTDVHSIWLFALASKCASVTPHTAIFIVAAIALAVSLLHWLHPGGPAWGKNHLWSKPPLGANQARYRPIPGPMGLPIIGSMSIMKNLAHQKIAAVANKYGARRLMAFSLGDTRVILTCHPDIAKEILNSSVFADRPVKTSAYSLMFDRAIGFAPYGVYWRTLRRIASAHMFSPRMIKESSGQRADIAAQMVALFGKRMFGLVTAREVIKRASLNNMMWAVFGRKYRVEEDNGEVAELRRMVDEGYELLGSLDWSDHLSWLYELDPQRIRARCSRLVPRVNRFVGRIIDEHRNDGPGRIERDFVDVLLSLQVPEKLSDSDMIAVLWEMIFRGTDTVAVLIEWVLARMVLHQDVQSTIQDELDKVVGRSRPVAESDLPSLVYFTAVIKEVLRLHPPGPLLSWARLAITDTVVNGHHIPAGTTAMINMWAISRDPEFWPEPLAFKPERFLQAPSSSSTLALLQTPISIDGEFSVLGSDLRLAPFGAGRRTCPGKALGLTTVSFWVASLLHEFKWVKPRHDASVDLSEKLKLSCEMVNPLQARVVRRRCVAN
ncbi:Cytochrome P450 78A6-like protein [Drosera capensis]